MQLFLRYVASLQLEDGSFAGDKWGEADLRFVLEALLILTALCSREDESRTIDEIINVDKVIEYVMSCAEVLMRPKMGLHKNTKKSRSKGLL